MKVLVTGGAGFLGSHLVDRLVEIGHDVSIFDNLDPQVHPGGKKPAYLNKNANFIKGDVQDREAFKNAIGDNEIIFHKAAAVGVGQSQYMVDYYCSVNIMGTSHLLDILANEKHSVKKVIVASSMSSYGEGSNSCKKCGVVRPNLRPLEQMEKGDWDNYCPGCGSAVTPVGITEDAELFCNSIYAITKKNQEEMVLNIGKTYDIPSVALRYFNIYGTRQSLSNPYTGVAAIFMSRIKNGHRPVIYEDGLQSRDFVSVFDIVNANILAMEKESANYQSINIGTGIATSIKSIAQVLAEVYGRSDIKPEVLGKYRKGDIRHCFADISKAKNLLGYEPKLSFKEGMEQLVKWAESADADDKFETATQELRDKGII